jgi:hypothetical protein
MLSFKKIHKLNNWAMPKQILLYKHMLQLFKLYISNQHSLEWILVNYSQVKTSRQTNFNILMANKIKVALNALANVLYILGHRTQLSWLNHIKSTVKGPFVW